MVWSAAWSARSRMTPSEMHCVKSPAVEPASFPGMSSHPGVCNVCGQHTSFFYTEVALYREFLVCACCLTTSRYRSIARGLLRAIRELTEIKAESLAEL